MMMKIMSLAVILAVLLLPLVRPSADGQEVEPCHDGRLCECKSVFNEFMYRAAKRITQCISEFGITHDFSEGSTSPIDEEVCLLYRVHNINNEELLKCVGRKAGHVITVNGIEQWNVGGLRNFLIRTIVVDFPFKNQQWIRDILINSLVSCPTESKDFKAFPYTYCLVEALSNVTSILENNNTNVHGLPLVGKEQDLIASLVGRRK